MLKKITRVCLLMCCFAFVFSSIAFAQTMRGLICYGGLIHDNGFNQMAYNGFNKAINSNKKTMFITDSFVNDKGDKLTAKNMRRVLASDWDFVIGVGQEYMPVFKKLAADKPETKFIVIDGHLEDSKLLNLQGIVFDEVQGGYLAGVAAASTSATGKIGFIGGIKTYRSNSDFYSGYRAGALSVNPKIVFKEEYVGSFNNSKKMENIARRMYRGDIDVIFHAAGASGNGLFQAAAKAKKFAIGCDTDQSLSASAQERPYILTSVIKRVDNVVNDLVNDLAQGKFTPGVVVKDYRTDSVTYATNEWNKEALKKAMPALIDAEAKLYLDADELEIKK